MIRFHVSARSVLVLALCLCLLPATVLPASAGWLQVSGSRIVEDDRPVTLRGFNAWLRTVDAEDLQTMKRWGYNVIRVNLFYADFAGADGALDARAAAWQQVRDLAGWARRADVRVVLSLHAAPGGGRLWTDPEERRRLIAFWTALARQCGDDPTIAGYNLLHAPQRALVGGPAALDGLYRELIAAIRDVDARRIVIVEGTRTSLGDANLVYGFDLASPRGRSVNAARGDEPGDYYPTIEPGAWLNDVAFAWLPDGSRGWTLAVTPEWTAEGEAAFLGVDAHVMKTNGRVRFDEMGFLVNGETRWVRNSGFEEAGEWLYTGSAMEAPAWSMTREDNRAGYYSAELGREPGWTTLASNEKIRILPGARYRGHGWINPVATEGRSAIKLSVYRAKIYGAAAVRQELGELARWGREHNVPVWIGEWGIPNGAPVEDARAYLADVTGALDELGLSWAYHVWREAQGGSSGSLFQCAGTDWRRDRSARTVGRNETRVGFFSALRRPAASRPSPAAGARGEGVPAGTTSR